MGNIKNIEKTIVRIFAFLLAAFHIYTSCFGTLASMKQRDVHITVALALCFLAYHLKNNKLKIIDYLFFLMSLIVGVAMYLRIDGLAASGGRYISSDVIIGLLFLVLVFEATRRTMGTALTALCLFFFGYTFFGKYLPGLLWHSGFSLTRVVGDTVWTTQGVFGLPLGVCATYIVMFVLFASFLKILGINDLFNQMANAIMGKVRGGPALVAVFSSALIGMITGSNVANIVTVGTVTIPLMKETGFEAEYAGAVEAVASSGGQIMPPIMGAGAFVMAEMLGISYGTVMLAAAIPAILYFLNIGVMVYLHSCKLGIKGLSEDKIVPIKEVLKKSYLLTPFVLVVVLLMNGYTPMKAGLGGIVSAIVISYFSKKTALNLKKIFNAMADGIMDMIPIAVACAAIGVIIDSISLTGLGLRLGMNILAIAGDNIYLILLLAMVIALIMGMGTPTTVAYIATVVVVNPILINLGVNQLITHMFVFFYGCLSAITPPVAISAFAAAPIAKANPNKIGWLAFRMSIVVFIIPFAFVFDPDLILVFIDGGNLESVINILTSIIGIVGFAIGIEGYFLDRINVLERAIIIVGSLLLIYVLPIGTLIGFLLVAAVLVRHCIITKKKRCLVSK